MTDHQNRRTPPAVGTPVKVIDSHNDRWSGHTGVVCADHSQDQYAFPLAVIDDITGEIMWLHDGEIQVLAGPSD